MNPSRSFNFVMEDTLDEVAGHCNVGIVAAVGHDVGELLTLVPAFRLRRNRRTECDEEQPQILRSAREDNRSCGRGRGAGWGQNWIFERAISYSKWGISTGFCYFFSHWTCVTIMRYRACMIRSNSAHKTYLRNRGQLKCGHKFDRCSFKVSNIPHELLT